MLTARVLLPAMIAAVLTLAGASQAAEPGSEAVATAPARPAAGPGANPSVAEQIDEYLKTSPALALPTEGPNGVVSGEAPRQAHGVVDLAVGSSGYRSAYVRSDLPVGKTGTLSIAVGESRFDGKARGFGGRFDPRCRRTGEDGPSPRSDGRSEGGGSPACQTAGERAAP